MARVGWLPREAGQASRPDYHLADPGGALTPGHPRARRLVSRTVAVLVVLAVAMAWSDRGTDWVSATVIVPPSMHSQYTKGSKTDDPAGEGVGDPRVTRHVYPMSVIPGGAYSVEELKDFVEKDPVAKKSFETHAKRLNDPELLAHVRVKRLTEPVKMYTQLREGEKLFFSSKRVVVQPGESGFVHEETGDLVARARCGNIMVVTIPAGAPTREAPRARAVQEQRQRQVGVADEGGVRPPTPPPPAPPPPAVSPPVPVQPAPPPVMLPPCQPAPIVCPPPPCPPTTVIPPPAPPPPPPPATVIGGGFSFPWWAALALAIPSITNVDQSQVVKQKQGQKQGQKQKQGQQQKQKQKQKQGQKTKPPKPPKRRRPCPPTPPTPPVPPVPPTPEPIPEPGTVLLMALGLAGAGLLTRRRWRLQPE